MQIVDVGLFQHMQQSGIIVLQHELVVFATMTRYIARNAGVAGMGDLMEISMTLPALKFAMG